jgi:HK97 family phage prohead protease
MSKKEVRFLQGQVEVRKGSDGKESRTISGYAAVFDSDSVDMGFIERLDKHCFNGVIEKSDVVALYNHSEAPCVLARSVNGEGTLKLEVDHKGLRCEFEAPNTQLGNDMIESVERGDIRGMSFAFTTEKDNWESDKEGNYKRTIVKIDRLYDVSLVVTPAYDATSVETKGLDELKAKELLDQHKEAAPGAWYYDKLRQSIY